MGSAYATLQDTVQRTVSRSYGDLEAAGTSTNPAFNLSNYYHLESAFLNSFGRSHVFLSRETIRLVHSHFCMWPASFQIPSVLPALQYSDDLSSDSSMPSLLSVHSDVSIASSTTTPHSSCEVSGSFSSSSEHSQYDRECCYCMVS